MASNPTASDRTLTTTDDVEDRASGLRLLRLTSVFVTVGYVAYGIVALPAIVEAASVMAPWWTPLAVVSVFGTGIGLGVFGFRATSSQQVKILARWAVIGFAVAMATWRFGWSGDHVNATTGIWFSMFFGVAGLAASLAVPPAWAFAILVVFAGGSTAINHAVRPAELNDSLLPDTAWAIGFSLVFVAAGTMITITAGRMDSTRENAYRAISSAAAADARAAERAWFDALTHDSVMATLIVASRHGNSPELAGHARTALTAIDQPSHPQPHRLINAADAIDRFRLLAANFPAVDFAPPSAPSDAAYPDHAVSELVAATAEAVRNSVRHAGPNATTQVLLTTADDALTVVVTDDGVGFDPDRIPPNRFGITTSIHGRLDRLDGASSTITSSRRGTRVEMRWAR